MYSTATSSNCIQMQNVTLSCICDFVFFFVLLRYDRFIYYACIKICMVTMKCNQFSFYLLLYQYITSYIYIYLLRGPDTDEDGKPSSFFLVFQI